MRKLIIALVALVAAVSAMAGTSWWQDYILVSLNGGGDAYFWIGDDPLMGTQFNGGFLGSIQQGQTLELGADMRYAGWDTEAPRNGGAYYRTIDSTSYSEMIWTQTSLGGNDYQGTIGTADNVAAGLGVGTHTVTVWAKSWGTGADGWLSNGGANYSATFSITAIPEPTTLVLVGLGVAGLLAYRRRR
jgi:hypothetical protein